MKKSVKKLSLNKMTISNLDASEMNLVNGGVIAQTLNCPKEPTTKKPTFTCSYVYCGTVGCPK